MTAKKVPKANKIVRRTKPKRKKTFLHPAIPSWAEFVTTMDTLPKEEWEGLYHAKVVVYLSRAAAKHYGITNTREDKAWGDDYTFITVKDPGLAKYPSS